MAQALHTPGPWEAVGHLVRVPFAHGDPERRGDLIAECPVHHAANATLIAEAPALLDGLREACDQLEGWINFKCHPKHRAEHQAFLAKLRGVIARASRGAA